MISYHTCPLASLEGKETGGLNVYVLELSKELGKLGLTIDIFTRSQSKHQPKIVKISSQVRLIHIAAGPQQPLSKKKLNPYLNQFSEAIISISQKESISYQIFHSHYYLSGIVGRKLNKYFPHSHSVITFHTLGLMKNLVARSTYEKEQSARIKTEHQLIKENDVIISSSENDRDYITYLYDAPKNKVKVVTPGVNTALFRYMDKNQSKKKIGVDINDHLILAVGRIEPLKGFDVLLYAIKILLKKNPSLQNKLCLLIVGGDVTQKAYQWSKELKKLNLLRKQLGLQTSVKFVDKLPQNKLPVYYSAADMVVMPSHYESFGMIALEAVASNTPVIATNVTGISGVIEKYQYGYVTSANNPLLLAKHIEKLISASSARKTSRKKSKLSVKDYSWKNIAMLTKSIYVSLSNK